MKFAQDDGQNLLVPMGQIFVMGSTGEFVSPMVPVVVDPQGSILTIEFEQHDVAALLNGGKLKLKILGTTLPSLAAWVTKP